MRRPICLWLLSIAMALPLACTTQAESLPASGPSVLAYPSAPSTDDQGRTHVTVQIVTIDASRSPVAGSALDLSCDCPDVNFSLPPPTDANGLTSAEFVATGPLSANVTVSARFGDDPQWFRVERRLDFPRALPPPPGPSRISLNAVPQQSTAGRQAPVHLVLLAGAESAGQPVRWLADGNDETVVDASGALDSQARASALWGATVAGPHRPCAQVGNAVACTQVDVAAALPAAARSAVDIVSTAARNDGVDPLLLRFAFADAFGNPTPDLRVTVTPSRDELDIDVLPDTFVTDANGALEVRVRSAVAGAIHLLVSAGGCSLPADGRFDTPAADANASLLLSSVAAAEANQPVQVTALMQDTNAQPIVNLPVAFSSDNANASWSSRLVITGADGRAQATYLDRRAGSRVLLAQAQNLRLRTTLTLTPAAPAPSTSVLALTPSKQLAASSAASATASLFLLDAFGNPVPQAPVAWSINGDGVLAAPTDGATDANGRATTAFGATAAGSVTVSAAAGNLLLSARVRTVAPQTSSLAVQPNLLEPNAASRANLVLTALDEQSQPRANANVRFGNPLGLWPGFSAAATTDANGVATMSVPAPLFGQTSFTGLVGGSAPLTTTLATAASAVTCPAGFGLPFAACRPIESAVFPFRMAAGDFDEDGALDLAVTDHEASARVKILRNNGSNQFTLSRQIYTAERQEGIAVADFDGDGHQDLVSVSNQDAIVSLFFGAGNGNFSEAVYYGVGQRPVEARVADLDNDGHVDIAVINSNDSTVSILWNDGHGAFNANTVLAIDEGANGLAVGHLTGSGLSDLLVSSYTASAVDVLYNRGNRTFQSYRSFPSYQPMAAVAAGDVDLDGIDDVVVGCSGHFGTYLSDGSGNLKFGQWLSLDGGSYGYGVALADLGQSGFVDLVGLNSGLQQLHVYRNRGDGTFADERIFGTAGSGIQALALPARGAAGVDVAVLSGEGASLEVVSGLGKGGLAGQSRALATPAVHLRSALPQAGRPPQLLALTASKQVHVLSETDDGAFVQSSAGGLGNAVVDVVQADFDGDGLQDLVALSADGPALQLFAGQANASFVPAGRLPVRAVGVLDAADFDADGVPELVLTAAGANAVWVLSFGGNLQGPLSLQQNALAASNALPTLLGDFDGDGQIDLVSLGSANGNGWLYPGGVAAEGVALSLPCAFGQALASDLDGDGLHDLVLLSEGDAKQLLVYRGQANRSFASWAQRSLPLPLDRLAVADFDGDRRPDLLGISNHGRLFAFTQDGSGLAGMPLSFVAPQMTYPSPAIWQPAGDVPRVLLTSRTQASAMALTPTCLAPGNET